MFQSFSPNKFHLINLLSFRARIQDADMYKISNFLCTYPEIVKLDLCYNDIGDEGIEILVDRYLSEENNLTYLNLLGCNITWKGVQFLCQSCRTLKLKTLRLNGNKLGSEVCFLCSFSRTVFLFIRVENLWRCYLEKMKQFNI